MVTVGQSPWDDIKILGPRLGHLISIFWAMWDTHYLSHLASPLRCPRAGCVHIKRGHVTIIEYVTKKCTIIHHFTWRYLSIKPRLSRWDRNGTLISKLWGKLWDIDIKHLTVSHCHHTACIWNLNKSKSQCVMYLSQYLISTVCLSDFIGSLCGFGPLCPKRFSGLIIVVFIVECRIGPEKSVV